MRVYKIILGLLIIIGMVSCQSDNSYLYEVNAIELASSNSGKIKPKTTDQYISILYANLFQKALSANELVEIRRLIESIGDKELAHELIISNFMNRPGVIIPSDEDMRGDIDTFLDETYRRFYVREPTEAEKAFLKNMIQSNPDITAELVYFSFAMSEEYQFY